MSKNIKSKIILIFAITGIVIIGILGFYYLNTIVQLRDVVSNSAQFDTILKEVENMQKNANLIFAFSIIVFLMIIFFLSKILSLLREMKNLN